MEKFLFALKAFSLGAVIIGVIFTICFFIIQKYANGHPHGLSGLVAIMGAMLALGIHLVIVIILTFYNKTDMMLSLWIALGLAIIIGGLSLLIEL